MLHIGTCPLSGRPHPLLQPSPMKAVVLGTTAKALHRLNLQHRIRPLPLWATWPLSAAILWQHLHSDRYRAGGATDFLS